MRTMIPIVAMLLLASIATVAVAETAEEPTTVTVDYSGFVGCSVGAGAFATTDNCGGESTFAYGADSGLTGMTVTFAYEAQRGETLQLRLYGPPGGNLDAGTHTFGADQVFNSSFEAEFDVRAETGVALGTQFTVEIVYHYGDDPTVAEPESAAAGTTDFTFDGHLGCSVGVGPLAVADRCDDDSTFAFTAPENVTGLTVTLEWDDPSVELSYAFTGPPGDKQSGASPLTYTYDNTSFEAFSGGWDGSVHVRAASGLALDVPFTVTLEFTTA